MFSLATALAKLRLTSFADRELTLVPKKGRPVTQCQHCRLERKKRSAHVKCDCGEVEKPHHPKEKCIHLREAEERAKAGFVEDHHAEKDPIHLAAVAEEQGCCCHHGGKCSCAILKKETGEDALAPHGPAVKPRLEKTSSDGAITVFTNGHHKPVHRKNHAAHECGMPYKMPMPRSVTEQNVSTAARRSVDSLALDTNKLYQPSAFMPQTSAPFNTERRKSKSEQPSPTLGPRSEGCSGLGDAKLTSIDFSTLGPTITNSSIQSASSDFAFASLEPMSGVTDSSFNWSGYPSGDSTGLPNNNPFDVWPTTNDSSSMIQPALTAASSGTQSEIDEMPPMDDVYGFPMPSIQEDAGGLDPTNMAGSNSPQSNRRSLPPGFFGNTDFGFGNVNNDWQASFVNFSTSSESKPQNSTATTLDDMWQPLPLPMNLPQRAIGNMPYGSRPQSRSVGAGSAPNDDIIKQLFPDIDIDGPGSSPQLNESKMANGITRTSVTSAPIDFGEMDTSTGFTSQAWSDGSMSVPNDTFTTSYDLDQDFPNPDYTANWPQ